MQNSVIQTSPQSPSRSQFAVSGMRCAACAQIIEYRLRQLPGVESVEILYGAARAEVQWQAQQTSLQGIIDAVVALGYRAMPLVQQGDDAANAEKRAQRMLLWRIFIAGFAMMQVMMYAFPAWLEPVPSLEGDLTPDIDRLLKIASACLSVPVFLFSAWPFYEGAWRSFKQRQLGMDVPVSIGIIATFIASVWATISGGAVYYDSLVMFVFLLLAARMVEAQVQQRSHAALRELTKLVPPQALLCPSYPQNLQTEQVLASKVQAGEVVLLLPGAFVPVDGIVLEGSGECDEALMTGEAAAIFKQTGDKVIAGALNLSGRLFIRAEQVGTETRIANLIAMMARAANQKPPLLQIADRHASHFLAVILLLAVVSGIVWYFIDPSRALPIALTVLVITCPCALSLATPSVMAAVIGQMAKRGMLVANGSAIEGLARATHFVFDKTGTLTRGQLQCQQVQVLRPDFVLPTSLQMSLQDRAASAQSSSSSSQDLITHFASSMASNSLHPIACAIAKLGPNLPAIATASITAHDLHIEEMAGQGLQASLADGTCYRLGNLAFVQALHGHALPQMSKDGSLAALGDQNGWIAIFHLQDEIREDAKLLLSALQQAGKQVWILSGDRSTAVSQLAKQLDVPAAQALGQLAPQEKLAKVTELQSNGAKVVVLGDGMNDGPVLSLADVSCAMGQGAPITQARSDLLLMSSNLNDFGYAWRSSQFALRLIGQNLLWALAYNIIAIPAAVLGWLAPWHAALGMSLSSVLVVLNSLRMLRGESEFTLKE